MGRGGCDPDYFLNKMSKAEAESYIEGLAKRPRDLYEATRLIGNVVHGVLTGKKLNWDFSWDNESSRNYTDEEIAEAIESARQMEEYMAQRMKNNGEDRRE